MLFIFFIYFLFLEFYVLFMYILFHALNMTYQMLDYIFYLFRFLPKNHFFNFIKLLYVYFYVFPFCIMMYLTINFFLFIYYLIDLNVTRAFVYLNSVLKLFLIMILISLIKCIFVINVLLIHKFYNYYCHWKSADNNVITLLIDFFRETIWDYDYKSYKLYKDIFSETKKEFSYSKHFFKIVFLLDLLCLFISLSFLFGLVFFSY